MRKFLILRIDRILRVLSVFFFSKKKLVTLTNGQKPKRKSVVLKKFYVILINCFLFVGKFSNLYGERRKSVINKPTAIMQMKFQQKRI